MHLKGLLEKINDEYGRVAPQSADKGFSGNDR